MVSTGGTSKHLRENGVAVVEVAEQTGFPEVMDGRVRTLHPRIHMPLLARAREPGDMALLKQELLEPFDLVVVNLYPFAQALAKGLEGDALIEEIDIGGPSLLRAASKNFERIAVVCEPADYAWILERARGGQPISLGERQALAAKAFAHCSRYDALIARVLGGADGPGRATLVGEPVADLRYGENPHQKAQWLRRPGPDGVGGLHESEVLHGKPLSFNNILDLDAAASACRDFEVPCAIAVKHNNPCGAGVGTDVADAVARALKADPVSVFGGIVACNRPVDARAAEAMAKIFLECVVAPDFSPEALEILRKKKDLRLLRWPGLAAARAPASPEFRTVAGGFLIQDQDAVAPWNESFKIIGESPGADVRSDLELAWKICARLQSNAIAIADGGRTVGLGMGQVNRVEAVEHAIARMRKHAPDSPRPVLASDAFFPFPDSIEVAAAAGIRWVIQPGGSIRDEAVVAKARELGVNMVVTGARHFRH